MSLGKNGNNLRYHFANSKSKFVNLEIPSIILEYRYVKRYLSTYFASMILKFLKSQFLVPFFITIIEREDDKYNIFFF